MLHAERRGAARLLAGRRRPAPAVPMPILHYPWCGRGVLRLLPPTDRAIGASLRVYSNDN